MKIFTSYFANSRKLEAAGIRMICVAIGRPKFLVTIPQMLNVAPTRYMISKACSHEEYLRLYDKILARQDAHTVLRQIERLSGGSDAALCCYEKPGDFCHRHILAKWLSERTGTEIEEFGELRKKAPEEIQKTLF